MKVDIESNNPPQVLAKDAKPGFVYRIGDHRYLRVSQSALTQSKLNADPCCKDDVSFIHLGTTNSHISCTCILMGQYTLMEEVGEVRISIAK